MNIAIVIANCGLLLLISLYDISLRAIPNSASAAVACLGLLHAMMGGFLPEALFCTAGLFAAVFVLWQRGWLGGGDAKLIVALSLGMSLRVAVGFVLAVAIAGGVLALVYLVTRRFLTKRATRRPVGLWARIVRAERWRLCRGGPLPYACAIAAGYLFVAT